MSAREREGGLNRQPPAGELRPSDVETVKYPSEEQIAGLARLGHSIVVMEAQGIVVRAWRVPTPWADDFALNYAVVLAGIVGEKNGVDVEVSILDVVKMPASTLN